MLAWKKVAFISVGVSVVLLVIVSKSTVKSNRHIDVESKNRQQLSIVWDVGEERRSGVENSIDI